MKRLEICSGHFMKWLKLKIIHVLLILNILRAYIDFADTIIFVDDFYKKKHIFFTIDLLWVLRGFRQDKFESGLNIQSYTRRQNCIFVKSEETSQ